MFRFSIIFMFISTICKTHFSATISVSLLLYPSYLLSTRWTQRSFYFIDSGVWTKNMTIGSQEWRQVSCTSLANRRRKGGGSGLCSFVEANEHGESAVSVVGCAVSSWRWNMNEKFAFQCSNWPSFSIRAHSGQVKYIYRDSMDGDRIIKGKIAARTPEGREYTKCSDRTLIDIEEAQRIEEQKAFRLNNADCLWITWQGRSRTIEGQIDEWRRALFAYYVVLESLFVQELISKSWVVNGNWFDLRGSQLKSSQVPIATAASQFWMAIDSPSRLLKLHSIPCPLLSRLPPPTQRDDLTVIECCK